MFLVYAESISSYASIDPHVEMHIAYCTTASQGWVNILCYWAETLKYDTLAQKWFNNTQTSLSSVTPLKFNMLHLKIIHPFGNPSFPCNRAKHIQTQGLTFKTLPWHPFVGRLQAFLSPFHSACWICLSSKWGTTSQRRGRTKLRCAKCHTSHANQPLQTNSISSSIVGSCDCLADVVSRVPTSCWLLDFFHVEKAFFNIKYPTSGWCKFSLSRLPEQQLT